MELSNGELRLTLRNATERLRNEALDLRNRGQDWEARIYDLIAQEIESAFARQEAERMLAQLMSAGESSVNDIEGLLTRAGERYRRIGEELLQTEREPESSTLRDECFYCGEELQLDKIRGWLHESRRVDHIALPVREGEQRRYGT